MTLLTTIDIQIGHSRGNLFTTHDLLGSAQVHHAYPCRVRARARSARDSGSNMTTLPLLPTMATWQRRSALPLMPTAELQIA